LHFVVLPFTVLISQRLEELKDLAQESPERHLQAVVVQPLVNLALKGFPQRKRLTLEPVEHHQSAAVD
jgi:hypothetical protein